MIFNYLLPLYLVCLATSVCCDVFSKLKDIQGHLNFPEMTTVGLGERIWRGDDASVGQFPYQALLYSIKEGDTKSFCGGSLISTKDILTAAHCCTGVKETLVILGLLDVANIYEDYIQKFIVPRSGIVIHPDYVFENGTNDICILHLPTEAQLNSNVSLIALPSKHDDNPSQYDSKYATVSGWGQTNNEKRLHRKLQYSTVHIEPHYICANRYSNLITNSQICCDKIVKHTGACHGDSGGPMTIMEGDKLVEIGLISWGTGSCDNHNPAVNTYVPYFLPWIKKNMSRTIHLSHLFKSIKT